MIEPSALAAAAAANNAHWCDLVCHAHCGATSFGPTFWICLSKAPPLYPNLVTLGGAEPAQAAAQIEGIEAVLSLDLPTQPAIKDSFRSLDLTNRGFDLLFEALWLARDPVGSTGRPSADAVFVRDATELAEWEAAWRLEEDTTDLPPRLFPENLLIEPDIGFVALRREGRIVAGAAVNSSADVVGMTNLFTGGAPADSVARAVAETISMRFPGLPIVDYETADRARELEGAGFRTVAPLAVWLAR